MGVLFSGKIDVGSQVV